MKRQLPLMSAGPHGSRNHRTCEFKCGFACDQPIPNTSGNEEMHTLVAKALARRSVVKGGAVGAGAMVIGGLLPQGSAAAHGGTAGQGGQGVAPDGVPLGKADFTPVTPNVRDNVTVPDGYRYDVVAKWGDPILKDSPEFDINSMTAESAAQQFGFNADYVGVTYLSENHAVMMVNHEYTDWHHMFPTGRYDLQAQREIEIQSHGQSIIEIERRGLSPRWVMTDRRKAKLNRRITGSTKFMVTGPAAGDARMKTNADPEGKWVLGTINNCSGGTTPWGTFLAGEENFNQYFDKTGDLDPALVPSYNRYGVTGNFGRGWGNVDPRFNLVAEPNEPFRFGWIVEFDPMDPTSTPRKHTMLGRFKHEGANIIISRSGHAVSYSGDDERGEYIYKFVSAEKFGPSPGKAARRHNMELLTKGTLYVGKFTGEGGVDGVHDGVGEWIPLASDTTSYVPGMTVADVLIDSRIAADKVGGTRMDRPEDVEPNPHSGKVYAALTNNSLRGTTFPLTASSPLASSMTRPAIGAPLVSQSGNRNGYILEITEDGGDQTSETFYWDLFLVCGAPEAPETYFAGFPKDQVSPISCPDNVAFDAEGNVWLSTDASQLGAHDGLFRVPTAGPNRGKVEMFLSVPVGAECAGPLISRDQRSVFAAIQHPGELSGTPFEDPSSTWPHTDWFPRPGVIVAYKA